MYGAPFACESSSSPNPSPLGRVIASNDPQGILASPGSSAVHPSGNLAKSHASFARDEENVFERINAGYTAGPASQRSSWIPDLAVSRSNIHASQSTSRYAAIAAPDLLPDKQTLHYNELVSDSEHLPAIQPSLSGHPPVCHHQPSVTPPVLASAVMPLRCGRTDVPSAEITYHANTTSVPGNSPPVGHPGRQTYFPPRTQSPAWQSQCLHLHQAGFSVKSPESSIASQVTSNNSVVPAQRLPNRFQVSGVGAMNAKDQDPHPHGYFVPFAGSNQSPLHQETPNLFHPPGRATGRGRPQPDDLWNVGAGVPLCTSMGLTRPEDASGLHSPLGDQSMGASTQGELIYPWGNVDWFQHYLKAPVGSVSVGPLRSRKETKTSQGKQTQPDARGVIKLARRITPTFLGAIQDNEGLQFIKTKLFEHFCRMTQTFPSSNLECSGSPTFSFNVETHASVHRPEESRSMKTIHGKRPHESAECHNQNSTETIAKIHKPDSCETTTNELTRCAAKTLVASKEMVKQEATPGNTEKNTSSGISLSPAASMPEALGMFNNFYLRCEPPVGDDPVSLVQRENYEDMKSFLSRPQLEGEERRSEAKEEELLAHVFHEFIDDSVFDSFV